MVFGFAYDVDAADGGPLSTSEPSVYAAPIVITTGGTYSGNWKTTSDTVPAVSITTSQPVVIEYSHIAGSGHLIYSTGQVLNLTVRHTSFHGKTPVASNRTRGCGIFASGYRNLVVENNFFENTATVVKTDEYSSNGTLQHTLVVRYNRVKNIDGRRANGTKEIVQFVGAQNYRQPIGNPRGGEIAWNEIINEPGKSCSEDLINFFKAGGRSDSWFKVHDNYLHGSYPVNVLTDLSSGSGMIVDGPDNNRAAYIEAYNNFVINTTNAGMNIAAGSNIWYHHNRIISTGKTAEGQWMPGSHAGVGIFNFYSGSPEYVGTMQNNVVENNVVGWAKQGYNSPYPNRNDNDAGANYGGAYKSSNVSLPNAPITQAMQEQEYQTFLQRVATAGVLLGPRAVAIVPVSPIVYLGDLNWTGSAMNGWGPPERNHSNGESGANDGSTIRIRGESYAKGIGVHAQSEITYSLNGIYDRFLSDIGVDDETNGLGSVVFQVWADGVKIFESGTLRGNSPVQTVKVSVAGKSQLKLIVTNAGDGSSVDHADWAAARLTVAGVPPSFNLWQQDFFSWLETETGAGGEGSDPDADGIPNLLEYYYGLNPGLPDGVALQPIPQITGGFLTMTYAVNPAKADVVLSVEQSDDLVAWRTEGVTDIVLSATSRRASVPAGGKYRFLRLRAESR